MGGIMPSTSPSSGLRRLPFLDAIATRLGHFAAWNFLRKSDFLPIVCFLVLTLAMSYPLPLHLFQSHMVGGRDIDLWVKLWDYWWFEQVVFHSEPGYFSRYLLYPTGANLSFHSISWVQTAVWWPFSRVLGPYSAHNLVILLTTFSCACFAYLLIKHVFNNRIAAWIGGVVFAFSPICSSASGSWPDLANIQWVPLLLLAVFLATERKQIRYVILAALIVALAAFTSLYILIFSALSVVLLVLYMAVVEGRWRDSAFIRLMAVFALLSTLLLALRLYPTLRNLSDLAAVVDKRSLENDQNDLAAFITPSRWHHFLYRIEAGRAERYPANRKIIIYLGVIPLMLFLTPLWMRGRKRYLFWYIAAVFFFLLSLGTILRVDGNTYPEVWIPGRLFYWLPFIRAVPPVYFSYAFLLPYAVVVGGGAATWVRRLEKRPIALVSCLAVLTLVILLEYWNGRFPLQEASVHPFYQELANEEGDFALIELPLGRQNSKLYMFYQTIHGRPMIEGIAARTVPGDYDFILGNELLSRLLDDAPLDCESVDYEAGLQELADNGFRYILLHPDVGGDHIPAYLFTYFAVDPYYQDDELAVYRIEDMLAGPSPCAVETP
jgi:hypothetical protein